MPVHSVCYKCLSWLPESPVHGLEQIPCIQSSQVPNRSGWNLLKISLFSFPMTPQQSVLVIPVPSAHPMHALLKLIRTSGEVVREEIFLQYTSISFLAKWNTNDNPLHFIYKKSFHGYGKLKLLLLLFIWFSLDLQSLPADLTPQNECLIWLQSGKSWIRTSSQW